MGFLILLCYIGDNGRSSNVVGGFVRYKKKFVEYISLKYILHIPNPSGGFVLQIPKSK